VLPPNYGYGNYINNAPRRYGKYPKDMKTEKALLAAFSMWLK